MPYACSRYGDCTITSRREAIGDNTYTLYYVYHVDGRYIGKSQSYEEAIGFAKNTTTRPQQ